MLTMKHYGEYMPIGTHRYVETWVGLTLLLLRYARASNYVETWSVNSFDVEIVTHMYVEIWLG